MKSYSLFSACSFIAFTKPGYFTFDNMALPLESSTNSASKDVRISKGYTQEDVADAAEVNVSHISNIERGISIFLIKGEAKPPA